MYDFVRKMNEVINDQSIVSFEMSRKGVNILWSGCLFSVEYNAENLHIVGDNIELNLDIYDKNIEKNGDNFVIETDDFSIFFNLDVCDKMM